MRVFKTGDVIVAIAVSRWSRQHLQRIGPVRMLLVRP